MRDDTFMKGSRLHCTKRFVDMLKNLGIMEMLPNSYKITMRIGNVMDGKPVGRWEE